MKQQPTFETQQSPLDVFVAAVVAMGKARKMIKPAVSTISDWPSLLEDLEMMVSEGVIHGLRSRWVRRVAVPVFQARRALQQGDDPKVQAGTALEILEQCTDEYVKAECGNWIREHHGK